LIENDYVTLHFA